MVDFAAHTSRIIDRIGQTVQYTPAGGSTVSITANFTNTPREFVGVEGFEPRITCKETDIPNPKHGDLVVIGSVSYKVIGKAQDSISGLTDLRLEKQ